MTTKKLSWVIGLSILAFYIVLAVIFESRLAADFTPIDRSFVGPNVVASFVLGAPVFAAGFITGRHEVKRIRAHHHWEATQMEKLHDRFGIVTDPHPHFDVGHHPSRLTMSEAPSLKGTRDATHTPA
jgi:hypothetical protein